jgi:hypothetical protein
MSGDAPDAAAREAPGEVMLSEALAGRTEGEARSCVRQQDVRNARTPAATLFCSTGPAASSTSTAPAGLPPITARDAIRHRTINTAICSGELIRIYDPQTGVEKGGCSLGTFVPWRRAR